MDQIRSFGSDFVPTILPTYKLLSDILNKPENASAIRATKRETFSYGPHQRHVLDLFTPSASAPNLAGDGPRRPVLLFVYGGGFQSGERVIAEVQGGLTYTNVGSFMADKLGFETIIMDYSLVQHGALYPSGGNEIEMVIKWLEQRGASKSRKDFYILGNSAGGVHVSTWLFEEAFQKTVKRLTEGQGVLNLKAILPVGSPFKWDLKSSTNEKLKYGPVTYYGDEKALDANDPANLMKKAISRSPGEMIWPPILVIVSELDPEYIMNSSREFADAWSKFGGTGGFWVLEGHNHLSPVLCLGTGGEKEEAWGYELVKRLHKL